MKDAAPVAALGCSLLVVAFLAGTLTAHFQVFPYPPIRDAGRTLKAFVGAATTSEADLAAGAEISSVPISDLGASRWKVVADDEARLPVIVTGGSNQYVEECPGNGCLALVYNGEGEVADTWPYRPDKIYESDITGGAFQHEAVLFDPRMAVYPVSTEPYDNGDLLVTFQATGPVFPFGVGIARVKPDGMPRWTRRDFTHHWATLGKNGVALAPALRVGDANVEVTLGPEGRSVTHTLQCKGDRPQLDLVQVVGPDGELLDSIDLIPLMLESPWAGVVLETTDPCDPLHLNFVDQARAGAAGGLDEGDLILSLRNVSRFAILDGETGEIKRIVGGSFLQQHSVQHVSGSKVLIFDNRGGDRDGGPSRIMEYDLATGGERQVFPTPDTPEAYDPIFSDVGGYLSISPDRQRVMATFSDAGVTAEIEISSGRLLSVYEHLHDISSVQGAPEGAQEFAARVNAAGVSYLDR